MLCGKLVGVWDANELQSREIHRIDACTSNCGCTTSVVELGMHWLLLLTEEKNKKKKKGEAWQISKFQSKQNIVYLWM
jgi:hypothetical protein